MKKGAMFGLDARIALAIFGALSVISGAALYSAIQNARVTAIVTELEEMSKAYQAYVLDTGENLTFRENPSVSNIALKTIDLLENPGITGWAGPYLAYSSTDMSSINQEHAIESDKYDHMFFIKAVTDNTFGSYTLNAGSQTTCVGNSKPCSIWIGFVNVQSKELAEAVDVMVDGQLGADSGKLRVRFHSTNKYAVYYEIMPDLVKD